MYLKNEKLGTAATIRLRKMGYDGKITVVSSNLIPSIDRYKKILYITLFYLMTFLYYRPKIIKQFNNFDQYIPPVLLEDLDLINKYKCECFFGLTVTSIDADKNVVILDDKKEISFTKLLISTGSIPKDITIPGRIFLFLRKL